MLAAKLMLNQNLEVEAVHFKIPFSRQNDSFIESFCRYFDINLHKVVLNREFLKTVVYPKHGYGSQMNPCVDCRILIFKKAKKLAEKIMADFIVTGEVLGERPFSQRKEMMLHIEKESGLEGKVLRPLSARLLPETDAEKKGLIDRGKLYAIKGRKRTPQIRLAKELGIVRYPNPSGGCLLTDLRFAERLREHLRHKKKITTLDIELLKVGRHFRIGSTKIIVGRNEKENKRLLFLASKNKNLSTIEVKEYMGPITVLVGETDAETIEKAAAITVRYSDAPKNALVILKYSYGSSHRTFETSAISDNELIKFRI